MSKRIGIDARNMLDPQNERGGGIERYTFTLVTKLIEVIPKNITLVIFLSESYSSERMLKHPQVEIVRCTKSNIPFFSTHIQFARQIKKYAIDLMHFPSPEVPLYYFGKKVITVHDLAIYDHPEWFPEGQFFSKKIGVPRSIKTADHIIAVSEDTKKSIQEKFGISENKISVIQNELPDQKYFSKEISIDLPKKYIVAISTLEPRKNYSALFEGFIEYKNTHKDSDLHLVVIGSEGWKIEEVFKKFSKKHLQENSVVFLENIPEKTKQHIIKKSQGLVMISKHEGFGLPVLEAQRQNRPTLISSNGALPELANKYTVILEKLSKRTIANGIESLLDEALSSYKSHKSEDVFGKKNLAVYKNS